MNRKEGTQRRKKEEMNGTGRREGKIREDGEERITGGGKEMK